jgi:hypothetical protein
MFKKAAAFPGPSQTAGSLQVIDIATHIKSS